MKLFLTLLLFFGCYTFLLGQEIDSLSLKMSQLGVQDLIEGQALLDDKVVGASRSAKKIEDLPLTIHVITQEEIQKNAYTTLADALKMVPGIRTAKVGNGISGEMFMLRGLEGNVYTKILLNNIPIQPSANGVLSIGEQLPISQVEKIEIIYGPSSAIYGADAMVGVINIITKNFQNSTFAQMNVTSGDYGYRHFNFMAGGKIGKGKNVVQFQILGNKGMREDMNVRNAAYKKIYSEFGYQPQFDGMSDEQLEDFIKSPTGYPIRLLFASNAENYKGSYINPTINALPQQSYMLGTNIKFRNFQFSFYEMYREDHSSLGRRPFFYAYNYPDSKIGEKMQLYSLNYSKSWNKLTLYSNIMYLKERYTSASSFATTYNYNGKSYIYQGSDDFFGEFVVNYNLSKKIELTGGASYKKTGAMPLSRELPEPFNPYLYQPFGGTIATTDTLFGNFGLHNVQTSNFGAFVQGFYTAKKFNMITSLRFDNPSNYDPRLYTRLAAMYKFNSKLTLRFSTGYAFKAPTLFTSYYSVALANRHFDTLAMKYTDYTGQIIYQLIPNKKLTPEESSSLDLGLRYKISDNMYLDASIFSTIVSNKIVTEIDPINKELYPLAGNDLARSYENDRNTNTVLAGLQIAFRARNIIKKIGLNINASYIYQEGTENLEDGRGTINFVREVPKHSLQAGVSFSPIKKLYFNFDNVLFSSWHQKSFSDTNIFDDKAIDRTLINGFYTLDMITRYTFNKNVSCFMKVLNVFDASYGGFNATGFDVDLKYTPQMGRNVQFGISFKID